MTEEEARQKYLQKLMEVHDSMPPSVSSHLDRIRYHETGSLALVAGSLSRIGKGHRPAGGSGLA